jgi:exosortase
VLRVSRHQGVQVAVIAAILAAGWSALGDTLILSLHKTEYTYILLILPVSIALLFRERRRPIALVAQNCRTGAALLGIALVITLLAYGYSTQLSPDILLAVRMTGVVISWIGAYVLCFGSAAASSSTFPLLFLFGLVPPPEIVLNAMVLQLQQGSAWAAHLLFAIFGVPVIQDGTTVQIPGLTLAVAPECSSIRSSSMLLVVTMVVAQLLLQSPWRKALVVGLVIPLSIAKNGLRIFTIAMLGTRVDIGYLTGKMHHQGGILFFLIALACILALVWILCRVESSSSNSNLKIAKPISIPVRSLQTK